jgi:group I intron endonuclease
MTGSIYSSTNEINGKMYIGQTTQPVKRRWNQHVCDSKKERDNTQLHKAIRKYGQDAFAVEELASIECENRDLFFRLLSNLEQSAIDLFETLGKGGYNWLHGGKVPVPGDFARERNPMFGRRHQPETIEKLKGPHSLEHRRRISEAKKGMPTWASLHPEEAAAKNRAAMLGRPKTAEHRKRISESRLGRFTGPDNPFFGKHHSEATRAKMRLAREKRRIAN